MIENIVENLNNNGFFKSNVYDLGFDRLFERNKFFLEKLINHDHVVHRAQRLATGNPIRDRKKFYELQNKQLLGAALGLQHGNILESYLQDIFLDIAEKYLQTSDPKLRNCLAFYHPQNPFPAAASQNWHRDQEDKKILKIFIYYNKVDKANGAVWYVRGSAYGGKNSHIWPNMHGGSANLDVSATNKIPPEDIVSFEGPPGTVCFFDSNGFHRGGRVTTGSRIATHACYLAPTAPHIVNNVLGSFEYNKDEINALDKQSAEYQLLSDRQKRVLE